MTPPNHSGGIRVTPGLIAAALLALLKGGRR